MFKDFQQYLKDQDQAALTVKGYLHDLSLFARWFEQTNGKPLSPNSLTPSDVREYRQHLLNVERRKPSTINRRLAAIRAFAAWAKESGQVSYNPVNGVKGVEEQPLAPKWLEKAERAALVRAAEERIQKAKKDSPTWQQAVRDRTLLVLMLNTGLRLSEVIALQMSDVVISDKKGELTVRSGKGTKARTIQLNKAARSAFEVWKEIRPDAPGGLVFCGQRGALKEGAINYILRTLAYEAKVEDVTPHTLRHTFAKNLVDSGVSLEKVATLLGHADLNTTRVYTTPGQHDLQKAVDTLDE